MTISSKPYFAQALDALKAGDRRTAGALLNRELREGQTSGRNLPSVIRLAEHIGEVEVAIEASRRSMVQGSIPSLLAYWSILATYGRSADALAEIARQSSSVRDHPSVLHFRGTVASQIGQFEDAELIFRRVLQFQPTSTQTWLTLAMLKQFEPGDVDIEAMERLEQAPARSDVLKAPLRYALGKAWEDCGDVDRAFGYYSAGAAVRRQQEEFDNEGFARAADRTIREFTVEALASLRGSGDEERRSLFVTGLPRSGTTLTEQLLLNSTVEQGGEFNLAGAALIPTMGITIDGARDYERRSTSADPWGDVGRDYAQLVDQHFRSRALVVDKSLGQSLLIGLMLHAMPRARIAWLRRSPEDVALSCFRNYFVTGLKWSWSLTDIAEYMRTEDRLFEHWKSVFGDRILTVPYEELVSEPDSWTASLQSHFGLPVELSASKDPKPTRPISTASSVQVRQPISTARIGQATKYAKHLKTFRETYYG